MNISNKDINLLYLFKVLYEEQNLSRAASRVALSQPALSHKLNKLRGEFDDELFVRASRGLTPTPLAHRIAGDISELVGNIEHFYQNVDPNDFLQNEDVVHIFTTDLIEQLLLPRLLTAVHEKAPKLQIVTHNTRGEFPKTEIETGRCDMAIAGFFQNLPHTFYQQTLRSERFVVLANTLLCAIKSNMDLEDYLANPHIVTTLTGDLQGIVDKKLADLSLSRHVVAGISSFTGSPSMLKNNGFLLTCLESIATHAVQNDSNLKIFTCPIDMPKIQICQIWHQRTHTDPMRRWLRQLIFAIMAER